LNMDLLHTSNHNRTVWNKKQTSRRKKGERRAMLTRSNLMLFRGSWIVRTGSFLTFQRQMVVCTTWWSVKIRFLLRVYLSASHSSKPEQWLFTWTASNSLFNGKMFCFHRWSFCSQYESGILYLSTFVC
jgi:hypothetical protein